MTVVMAERDEILDAVRIVTGAALEGRGGALFVAGEAGLGKTTVLEHAVAITPGRFKAGIGRADVAEAALPFGVIGQALAALLGGPAGTCGPGDPQLGARGGGLFLRGAGPAAPGGRRAVVPGAGRRPLG